MRRLAQVLLLACMAALTSAAFAFDNGQYNDVPADIRTWFKSVMAPNLRSVRLLPIEVPKSQATVDYIYEQKPSELLGSLLPRYIKVQIFRSMLESAAAEHAARMTAMDAATSNANDVIDRLTLYMNRVRQASITREIIEIVSGAAALD